jgi:hypothetical protein
MSVENKIRELLDRAGQKQTHLTEESKEDLTASGIAKAAMNMSRDTSKAGKAANAGDTTQPKQGSSKDASFTEMDEDEPNIGSKSASSVSKDTTLPTSKGDAKSVRTPAMEEGEVNGETITEDEVDVQSQLNSIFGEELSEEFKTKATSIFEAAVIARVNSEMDKVTAKLEEQNVEQLAEFKEVIVEKVDSYLNYIVEQWMEENQLAVESGLRTEIAEEFMSGLKTLFKEHYIDVPEEKYNVLGELQAKSEELEEKLNEAIESNVAASRELAELKAAKVIEEQTKGLADTEVEKLKKLVEGVDFEDEELYREKVAVIKENYFPKAPKNSPEKVLVEHSAGNANFAENDTMSRYMSAISRTVKTR